MSCSVHAPLLLLISGMVALSSGHQNLAQGQLASPYLRTDQYYAHWQPAPAYLSTNPFFGHQQLTPEFLPANIDLGSITLKSIDEFLANRPAVLRFVSCLKDARTCQTSGEYNLARQIKGLGRWGQCYHCTSLEQTHIRYIMHKTIAGMQKYYHAEWYSLVPVLSNLF